MMKRRKAMVAFPEDDGTESETIESRPTDPAEPDRVYEAANRVVEWEQTCASEGCTLTSLIDKLRKALEPKQ